MDAEKTKQAQELKEMMIERIVAIDSKNNSLNGTIRSREEEIASINKDTETRREKITNLNRDTLSVQEQIAEYLKKKEMFSDSEQDTSGNIKIK